MSEIAARSRIILLLTHVNVAKIFLLAAHELNIVQNGDSLLLLLLTSRDLQFQTDLLGNVQNLFKLVAIVR